MSLNPFLRSVVGVLALTLVVGLTWAVRATGAEDDAAAVEARFMEFVTGWNKHDPKAMASVWADDGDLINPWGRLASGRSAVESLFGDEHSEKGALRASTMRVRSESRRLVMPGLALYDAELTISGMYGPDGAVQASPSDFHVTCLWKKTGETWAIYACRPYLKPPTPPAVH